MLYHQSTGLAILLIAVFLNLSCSQKNENGRVATSDNCTYQWTNQWREHTANPVINARDALAGIIWNDPSVMKEGNNYTMWLSGGKGLGVNHVRIYSAASTDGSNFTHYDADNDGNRDAVLVQSSNYSVENNYRGYSTPFAVIDSKGMFHLFTSVVNYPTPGAWSQIAIAHATSGDGKSFAEIEHDIFTNGRGDWKDHETWGPSVLQEDNRFKIWFAGQNGITYNAGTGLYDGIFGIGYASYDATCQ